jgi:hypothetical protein
MRTGLLAVARLDRRHGGELDHIEAVRYQLHQTFPEPTRVVNDRASKFALSSMGWGEFTIYAAVKFKDAKREEQLLNHWLSLGGSPKDPPRSPLRRDLPPVCFSHRASLTSISQTELLTLCVPVRCV